MAPFIGQVFIEAEGRGWTENYYVLGTTHTTALTSLNNILTARLALSLGDVNFLNLRVSDMTIRGDSRNFTPTTQFGTYVDADDLTIDPDIAVLIRENGTGDLNRALRYMRGVPRKVFNLSPLRLATFPATWNTNLNTYAAAVIANSQLVQRHAGTPPTFTTVSIATVAAERATIRRAGRPFGQQPGRRVRA